jgi:hypothetical protein
MSSYAESCTYTERQEMLWRAERNGLASALKFSACLTYSKDDEEVQQRFRLGFERGRDQLAIEAATKTKEAVWQDPT